MAYRIELTRSAERALQKLPRKELERVDRVLLALGENPRPVSAVRLRGEQNYRRIRVGDYRVVYLVEEDQVLVLVIRIGHRSEVYRKL